MLQAINLGVRRKRKGVHGARGEVRKELLTAAVLRAGEARGSKYLPGPSSEWEFLRVFSPLIPQTFMVYLHAVALALVKVLRIQ